MAQLSKLTASARSALDTHPSRKAGTGDSAASSASSPAAVPAAVPAAAPDGAVASTNEAAGPSPPAAAAVAPATDDGAAAPAVEAAAACASDGGELVGEPGAQTNVTYTDAELVDYEESTSEPA